MIRIGVLTSSRADYGIYLPLLKALNEDNNFQLEVIVFGTHLSKFHGYTVTQIENDGFKITKRIESLLIGDTPNAIATSYALTVQKFADYWEQEHDNFDFILALGDRFEMAAAVAASIPFGVKIGHIHGGETTLGAIDNIYRHSISLASSLHFVSAQPFANRVQSLLDNNFSNVYHIGSLSLENLQNLTLLTKEEFLIKWEIDLNNPSLLVTVHPETVEYNLNSIYCQEMNRALDILSDNYQVIITMPNADTAGILFREAFLKLASLKSNINIIENFGTQSYFTCMKYSQLMIGNTSSGIVEAATFKKYVLNLGDRQKGRLSGENVIHIPFDSNMIVQKANEYSKKEFLGENLYFKPNPSKEIIEVLKNEFASIQ